MWSPPRERPAQPPGAYAVVTVEDPAGRFTDYAISRDTAARGVSIGSDPACDVRLSGRKVRPVHARLDPKSNHWVVTYLPNGAPLPLQETEAPHDDRVDRAPFEIEGHVLQIHDSYVW
jgi:hypothetical protein